MLEGVLQSARDWRGEVGVGLYERVDVKASITVLKVKVQKHQRNFSSIKSNDTNITAPSIPCVSGD